MVSFVSGEVFPQHLRLRASPALSLTRVRGVVIIRGFVNYSEGFPSGQRDQTVNLTALPSKVRILPPPPEFGSFDFDVADRVCGQVQKTSSGKGARV